MLDVWPVYPHWLCCNGSSHEALAPVPGPAFVHQPVADHVEVTCAKGFLPFSQKFSQRVNFDGFPVALEGHDAGPLILHVTKAPFTNNLLLPLTLLGSSTKWPFSACRRMVEGRAPAGFRPLMIPYTFCHSREAPPKKAPEAPNSKAPPKAPNSKRSGPDASTKTSGTAADAKAQLAENLTAVKNGVPGFGVHCFFSMVCRTVVMPLGLDDFVRGVFGMAINIGASVVVSKAFKRVGLDPRSRLEPLQKSLCARLGNEALNSEAARKELKDLAIACAKGYVGQDIARKMIGGYASGGTVDVPYGIASLDPNTGNLKVFGWTTNTGWALNGEFKGYQDSPYFKWVKAQDEEPKTCESVAWWNRLARPADPEIESVDESDLVSEEEPIGYCEDEPQAPLAPCQPEPADPWAEYWLDGVPHAS